MDGSAVASPGCVSPGGCTGGPGMAALVRKEKGLILIIGYWMKWGNTYLIMHFNVIAVIIFFLKLISKCYHFWDILIMRYCSWADLYHQSCGEWVSKGKACYCSDTSVKLKLGYPVNFKLTNMLAFYTLLVGKIQGLDSVMYFSITWHVPEMTENGRWDSVGNGWTDYLYHEWSVSEENSLMFEQDKQTPCS